MVTLAAQAVWGVETWTHRGEAFSVYFNLLSRISVIETRDRVVGLRPPLGGLPRLDPARGTVAFVAVMIGTVTFDGLSQGSLWGGIEPTLQDLFTSLGFTVETALDLAGTVGLVGRASRRRLLLARDGGCALRRRRPAAAKLRMTFVHSLVPIAAVYVLAHYLTYLVFEGQAIQYLASDPFGQGWDLFGTASAAIDFSLIGDHATWYAQVALVVIGHVAALTLAHDRALATYGQANEAVRSQYWMLSIMVGFTCSRSGCCITPDVTQAEGGGGPARVARGRPTPATRAAPGRRAARSVVTRPVGKRSSSRSVYWKAAVDARVLVPGAQAPVRMAGSCASLVSRARVRGRRRGADAGLGDPDRGARAGSRGWPARRSTAATGSVAADVAVLGETGAAHTRSRGRPRDELAARGSALGSRSPAISPSTSCWSPGSSRARPAARARAARTA